VQAAILVTDVQKCDGGSKIYEKGVSFQSSRELTDLLCHAMRSLVAAVAPDGPEARKVIHLDPDTGRLSGRMLSELS
jgi:hypothetical protein